MTTQTQPTPALTPAQYLALLNADTGWLDDNNLEAWPLYRRGLIAEDPGSLALYPTAAGRAALEARNG